MLQMTNDVKDAVFNAAGLGYGFLIISLVTSIFWLFLIKFAGLIGKKLIYFKPELIEEDRINGTAKYSKPYTHPAPLVEAYEKCSQDFQTFIWFLIMTLPIVSIISIGLGSMFLISFYSK